MTSQIRLIPFTLSEVLNGSIRKRDIRQEKPETKKRSSAKMATIEIWTYDVWGNDEDGYDVNDRSKVEEYETDLKELTDEEIKKIVNEYFFHPENIETDAYGDDKIAYLVINDKEHCDYPLGEIILTEY